MKTKKTIFLTGATGNMGYGGLTELLRRKDRFDIVILARDSAKNRKLLAGHLSEPCLKIIWGDLCNYEDVLKGVTGADYVLHVGGMVSPKADMYPEETMRVNITAAENIVRAVKAQPDRDEIGVVYIGSVAQTGNRLPPNHWSRCGDPVYTSVFDFYSVSKCIAELVFAESGLRKWVSVRQSGMLYPALLKKANDPITYHVPFKGVLEWSTVEDSARVLANICEDGLPDEFWRNFYNLSSGPSYRLTNYEFEKLLLGSINCPPVEKIFRPNWFATRNFHGQWYTDADRLEEWLHFRENIDSSEYFKRMKKSLPWYFSLAPLAPAFLIRMFMKHVASSHPLGTLYWIRHNITGRINAHFGSLEEYRKIPAKWKDFDCSRPESEPVPLDHGYDESKPVPELDIDDMRKVAAFRGGECLSENMTKGDLTTPLKWRCYAGHEFTMSPNSVLKGGHWCPECLPKYVKGQNTWNFEEIAKHNPFFAQVYAPDSVR